MSFFDPEDRGRMFLRNVATFNGLYGIISQKTAFFITSTVRASVQQPYNKHTQYKKSMIATVKV
jgi:ABC-type transporter Mla maintaining outer membrane lipid asymmetry ATPase subunit MlaF